MLLELATIAWLMQASLEVGISTSHLSFEEKTARVAVLGDRVIGCYEDALENEPSTHVGTLSENIVAASHFCTVQINDLIAEYDLYFGEGEGEKFFYGTFLDELPKEIKLDRESAGH